jgi:methylase of polypeptide subunit release factors
MDFLHHVYAMLLGGKLHLAPLKALQNILDLGTGTGIWAIDFGDQYPSAKVLGRWDIFH